MEIKRIPFSFQRAGKVILALNLDGSVEQVGVLTAKEKEQCLDAIVANWKNLVSWIKEQSEA